MIPKKFSSPRQLIGDNVIIALALRQSAFQAITCLQDAPYFDQQLSQAKQTLDQRHLIVLPFRFCDHFT